MAPQAVLERPLPFAPGACEALNVTDEPEVEIATASSRKVAPDKAQRWTDIEIARRGDRYVVRAFGRSTHTGETERVREYECRTGKEILAALAGGTAVVGKLPRIAQSAIARAATNDARFDELVAGLGVFEDLSPDSDSPSSAPAIILERHDQPPLRFRGRSIGGGTSQIPGASYWTTFALYRVENSNQIVAVKMNHPEPVRRYVIVVTSAAEVVLAFTRPGVGWVEGALLDALELAADADEAIDQEIGDENVTDWAHDLVGSTSVQVGDARYNVLTVLENGGTLLARNGAAPGLFVRLLDRHGNTVEDITKNLFLTLSRQRLIYRLDFNREEGEVVRWGASYKGLDTLNDARLTTQERDAKVNSAGGLQ